MEVTKKHFLGFPENPSLLRSFTPLTFVMSRIACDLFIIGPL